MTLIEIATILSVLIGISSNNIMLPNDTNKQLYEDQQTIVRLPQDIVVDIFRVQQMHPFKDLKVSDDTLYCMAQNMYHEARGEKDLGIIAVGYVLKNLALWGEEGGHDICKVLRYKNAYQYMKNIRRLSKVVKYEKDQWNKIVVLAHGVLHGYVINPIGDSKYHCAPKYSSRSNKWCFRKPDYKIGIHHFFKKI